ncbi:hypothetical protein F4604DRAFT_1957903 [Suillus subluteus]|nr:hypothetical protein F4604DRAFT_1957903 [Suillus subluteus]
MPYPSSIQTAAHGRKVKKAFRPDDSPKSQSSESTPTLKSLLTLCPRREVLNSEI